jgi:hypothetical protein
MTFGVRRLAFGVSRARPSRPSEFSYALSDPLLLAVTKRASPSPNLERQTPNAERS